MLLTLSTINKDGGLLDLLSWPDLMCILPTNWSTSLADYCSVFRFQLRCLFLQEAFPDSRQTWVRRSHRILCFSHHGTYYDYLVQCFPSRWKACWEWGCPQHLAHGIYFWTHTHTLTHKILYSLGTDNSWNIYSENSPISPRINVNRTQIFKAQWRSSERKSPYVTVLPKPGLVFSQNILRRKREGEEMEKVNGFTDLSVR